MKVLLGLVVANPGITTVEMQDRIGAGHVVSALLGPYVKRGLLRVTRGTSGNGRTINAYWPADGLLDIVPRKRWSPDELTLLADLYPRERNTTLAAMFDTTLRSIRCQAAVLGLAKAADHPHWSKDWPDELLQVVMLKRELTKAIQRRTGSDREQH